MKQPPSRAPSSFMSALVKEILLAVAGAQWPPATSISLWPFQSSEAVPNVPGAQQLSKRKRTLPGHLLVKNTAVRSSLAPDASDEYQEGAPPWRTTYNAEIHSLLNDLIVDLKETIGSIRTRLVSKPESLPTQYGCPRTELGIDHS